MSKVLEKAGGFQTVNVNPDSPGGMGAPYLFALSLIHIFIVLFCIIPMVAWAATLIAMKGYTLTGEKMKEIQAVNACRRDACLLYTSRCV